MKATKTNEPLYEISEGFESLTQNDSPPLIDPSEMQEIMASMDLKRKMPFIYSIFSSLCSNEKIIENGGISQDDLINLIDEKLANVNSVETIKNIYEIFSVPNSDSINFNVFSQTAKEIGDTAKEKEIKALLGKSQLNSKDINFDEFYEIISDKNKSLKNSLNYNDNKNVSYKRVRLNRGKHKYEKNNNGIERSPMLEMEEERVEEPEVEPIIEERSSGKKHYRHSRGEKNKIEEKAEEIEENKIVKKEENGEQIGGKRYHRRYRDSSVPLTNIKEIVGNEEIKEEIVTVTTITTSTTKNGDLINSINTIDPNKSKNEDNIKTTSTYTRIRKKK